MSILIPIVILMIIFYSKSPKPKPRFKEQRIQEQEDKKQRAIDRMPKFGYFIYHISPNEKKSKKIMLSIQNTNKQLSQPASRTDISLIKKSDSSTPEFNPLDHGLIGMTNTLEEFKEYIFNSLKEGSHNNPILQKAWNNKAFSEDDFHILHENLSGRKACEVTVELRSQDYMGWNQARGGWAWNDEQFRDPE